MNDQYGGHTQLVSVVAGIVMLALLFTGTGFIEYLPVPVLTAIVICALMKVVEVHLRCGCGRCAKETSGSLWRPCWGFSSWERCMA